jgi:hypothetical protein
VDDWRGSTLVSRSSNPIMNLDNVDLISRTGVIFRSTIDWEGSNKKSQFSISNGTEASGIALNMNNMKVEGDIIHDDFFRKMNINLKNTRLTGRVFSGTKSSWNAKWSADALQSGNAWKAAKIEITSWAKGAPNHVFTFDPAFIVDAHAISKCLSYDGEYHDIWGVRMNIDPESAWTVTGNSSLYSLTIANGATINAPKGCKMTVYKDCKMDNDAVSYDYAKGTIVNNIEPGVTYKGVVIVVQGKSE